MDECRKCHRTMSTDEGCDPTDLCHNCAHEEVERLTAERDEALKLANASEQWRLAYQDGKMKLYEMGGEVAEAALKHLPCNEGGIDRLSRKIFLYPHFEAWKVERDTLRASNARLRAALEQPIQTHEAEARGLYECSDPEFVEQIQAIYANRAALAEEPK